MLQSSSTGQYPCNVPALFLHPTLVPRTGLPVQSNVPTEVASPKNDTFAPTRRRTHATTGALQGASSTCGLCCFTLVLTRLRKRSAGVHLASAPACILCREKSRLSRLNTPTRTSGKRLNGLRAGFRCELLPPSHQKPVNTLRSDQLAPYEFCRSLPCAPTTRSVSGVCADPCWCQRGPSRVVLAPTRPRAAQAGVQAPAS